MASGCIICAQKDREKIEDSIMDGSVPMASVAGRFDVSQELIFEHMENHLQSDLSGEDSIVPTDPANLNKLEILMNNLAELNDKLAPLMKRDLSSPTVNMIVKLHQEIRKTVETIAKLDGELTEENRVTLIQFNQFQTVVINAMQELCPECQKRLTEEFGIPIPSQ